MRILIISLFWCLGAFAQALPIIDTDFVEKPIRTEYVTIEGDNFISKIKDYKEPEVSFSKVFVKVLESDYISWGFDKVNVKKAWEYHKPKRTITVAVLDTGVDGTHEFVKDNIIEAYEYMNNNVKAVSDDPHGHGTHVTGIIKSVNPEIRIISYRYTKGAGTRNSHINSNRALAAAISDNVDIINYSGGGRMPNDGEKALLLEAQRKGILVVVAAGNEEEKLSKGNCNYYPACYDMNNIISVGAIDQSGRVLSTSNYGSEVDVVAPGYRIKSSHSKVKNGKHKMTGTSMATPFVTGVASLIMSNYPDITVKEVRSIIKSNSMLSLSSLNIKNKPCVVLDAKQALLLAKMRNKEIKRSVAMVDEGNKKSGN